MAIYLHGVFSTPGIAILMMRTKVFETLSQQCFRALQPQSSHMLSISKTKVATFFILISASAPILRAFSVILNSSGLISAEQLRSNLKFSGKHDQSFYGLVHVSFVTRE